MKSDKIKETTISIDELMRHAEPVTDDTYFYSLVRKLQIKPAFNPMPSWFDDLEVPENIIPSTLAPSACWFQLRELMKKNKPVFHPVHTIDNVITYSDIKMTGCKMAYTSVEKQPVTVPYMRGYFLPVEQQNNAVTNVAAAHVADVIGYYSRANLLTDSVDPIAKKEEMSKLAMLDIDCLKIRSAAFMQYESETKTRDYVFEHCMKNPEFAFTLCTTFCKQFPQYSEESGVATQANFEILKKKNAKTRVEKCFLPLPSPVPVINLKGNIRSMYDFLLRSRGVRGEDNGPGSLTFSYLLGCMPRNHIKTICLFLDIRQCFNMYGGNVIVISGNISEAVVRMLVVNGYFVVLTSSGFAPKLTVQLYKDSEFGIYSSIEKNIPYGIYHEIDSKCPDIAKKVIKYYEIDVMSKFNFLVAERSSCDFHMLRAHITPQMENPNKLYGILPGSMAHNGQVLCVFPPKANISIIDMVNRCVTANVVRNNWIITKRLFSVLDKNNGDCCYFQEFIIPRMRLKEKGNSVDYSKMEKEELDALIEHKVDTTAIETYKKPQTDVSPEVMLAALIYDLVSSGDVANYIKTMCINWESNSNFVCAKVMRDSGHDMGEIIQKLQDGAPKVADAIVDGYTQYTQYEASRVPIHNDDDPEESESEDKGDDPLPTGDVEEENDSEESIDFGKGASLDTL